MRPKIKGEYFDGSFILSALFAWFLSALLLLILSSIILNEAGCSEKALGYTSSVISFVSAFAAGIVTGRKRKTGALYASLLTASFLVVALLTVGFLVNGSSIEPSAVMSVISFSFAGCVAGGVMFPGGSHKKKKYKPQL